MQNRLYRSRTDSMIGGVCGGLGTYLSIDPVLVRLFFVLLALGSGVGVFLYIILWIILPYPDRAEQTTAETMRSGAEEMAQKAQQMGEDVRAGNWRQPNTQTGIIIGGALIALGAIFLLRNLHFPWLWWLNFDVLWPVLLIAGGAALLWRRIK